MRFQGKRAVVTGGASGIGRATALRLAEEGADVLIGDIDEAGGQELAETSNGRIRFQRTDVTRRRRDRGADGRRRAAGGLESCSTMPARAARARRSTRSRPTTGTARGAAAAIGRARHPLCRAADGEARRRGDRQHLARVGAGHRLCADRLFDRQGRRAAPDQARRRRTRQGTISASTRWCRGSSPPTSSPRALGLEGASARSGNGVIAQTAAKAQPIARAGRPEDIAAAVAFLASDDAASSPARISWSMAA